MKPFQLFAAAMAIGLLSPTASAQTGETQLNGAVFLRENRLDGLLLSSERFEVRGARGTFRTWSTGEGRDVKRCRLDGLLCVIDAHLEIRVATDGESVSVVTRRSDGRENGSFSLPRTW